jgi:hypothetical protein
MPQRKESEMSNYETGNLQRAHEKKLALHGNINGRIAIDDGDGHYRVKIGGQPVTAVSFAAFASAIFPYSAIQEDNKPDGVVKKALRRSFHETLQAVKHTPWKSLPPDQRSTLIQQAYSRLGLEEVV